MNKKKKSGVRLNLQLSHEEVSLLKDVQAGLGAVSLTEGIRKSARLAEKILEFQKDNTQIILRAADGNEKILVIV